MTKKTTVKGQRESLMARLLRPRGEVVAVVPSDVDADPAALAPPLVGVGSQTGGTDEGDVCPRLSSASRCNGGGLPGLDVLRHDAPRQVIVAVVAPRVVEEVRPRREHVSRKSRAALWDQRQRWTLVITHFPTKTWRFRSHSPMINGLNLKEK